MSALGQKHTCKHCSSSCLLWAKSRHWSAIRSLHQHCRAAKFGRDLGKMFAASLRPTPPIATLRGNQVSAHRNRPKVAAPVAGRTDSVFTPQFVATREPATKSLAFSRQLHRAFGRNPMSALRLDQFLASAALVFILAAPVSALGQQTEPSQAGLRAPSKAGDASAGDALTSPPASATQTAAPAIAPEESRALDRLPALDPADRDIPERIRNLLDTKPNRIFADEKAHAAVEAFYQKRNLAPLWLDKGVENARSKVVIARLKNADADGLDHADYKTPTFGGLSPDALAEAELSLTQTVLTYARHLQAGRVPHRQVREDNIALPHRAPDPAVVLAAVGGGDDAGQALDQFSPPYENYRKLKAALSQLRGRTAGGARNGIAAGRMLTFNRKRPMEDARVPQLRERLGVPGEATDLRYDEKLAKAVKAYQRGNDLPPTGNLDARTVKKLNPTNDSRIDTIIANMERWRWYHR